MSMEMIRAALVTKSQPPYGGQFSINRPDIGMVGGGTNFEMLMRNLRNYRKSNAIPMGLEFEDEVEREICKLYPAACHETSNLIPNRDRTYSFSDVIHGTKAMIAFKLAGSPLVSQEEANKRAAICSHCPNNGPFTKPCGGICGELQDIVVSLIGGKTTPMDAALNSCYICNCFNRASVWVELDVMWKTLTPTQKEQFKTAKEQYQCWKFIDDNPQP